MRPKFRVWSKKRNGWLTPEDSSLHCSSNWMMDIFSGEIIDFTQVGDEYHPDPEPKYFFEKGNIVNESPFVVQQWTGMVDKQGVDVYDGDIVKYTISNKTYVDRIRWENFGWYLESLSEVGGLYPLCSAYNLQIIGNIFENFELLNTNI